MRDDDFIRTRGGARLFVRDSGHGAPVLLLPGWAMGSDLWATVMLRLEESGLRAISYDRRGHGRSSDPGPYVVRRVQWAKFSQAAASIHVAS